MADFVIVPSVEIGIAVIGYFLSLLWARTTKYRIDEDGNVDSSAKNFLLKMWGGMALLLIVAFAIFKLL